MEFGLNYSRFFSYIEPNPLSENFAGFNKNQTGTTPFKAELEPELTQNKCWFGFLAHRQDFMYFDSL